MDPEALEDALMEDIDIDALMLRMLPDTDNEVDSVLNVGVLPRGLHCLAAQSSNEMDDVMADLDGLCGISSRRGAAQSSGPDPSAKRSHEEQMMAFFNGVSINWVGYQLAVLGGELPLHHPLTMSLHAAQRIGWGFHFQDQLNTSYYSALLLRSLENGMVEQMGLKLFNLKCNTPEESRVLMWSIRQDSTMQLLKFTEAQAAKRLEWIEHALARDTALEPEDRTRLRACFAVQRQGLVHILTVRARLRWGLRRKDAEAVLCRCMAIGSANAACIRGGMFGAVAGVNPLQNLKDMSPVVPFSLLHVGSDRASGDERLHLETGKELRPYRSIGRSWR